MKTVEIKADNIRELTDADECPIALINTVDEVLNQLNQSTDPDDHVSIILKIVK